MQPVINKKQRSSDLSLSRIIVLGDIDTINVNYAIEDILNINDDDIKKKRKSTYNPIKLIINSPGGDVYAALGLIDVIKNSTTPIHTYCYGHAMSAGFFIFVCGHRRFSGKLATFMYHDVSTYFDSTVTSLRREMGELDRLVKVVDKVVIEHTNIQIEYLDSIKERHENKYFTSEEAKELGIIDEIL